jgi:hypothetical protein
MLAGIRDVLYRAIATGRGDSLTLVRVSKDLARRLNETLGRPVASREELARRSNARARLQQLRATGSSPASASAEQAPVLVYFEGGRNVRELTRIEELLLAKAIAWKRLDVSNDEATLEFVTRQAQCERDDLPVVFVADRAIGPYPALVRADVSGELRRLVDGRGLSARGAPPGAPGRDGAV